MMLILKMLNIRYLLYPYPVHKNSSALVGPSLAKALLLGTEHY